MADYIWKVFGIATVHYNIDGDSMKLLISGGWGSGVPSIENDLCKYDFNEWTFHLVTFKKNDKFGYEIYNCKMKSNIKNIEVILGVVGEITDDFSTPYFLYGTLDKNISKIIAGNKIAFIAPRLMIHDVAKWHEFRLNKKNVLKEIEKYDISVEVLYNFMQSFSNEEYIDYVLLGLDGMFIKGGRTSYLSDYSDPQYIHVAVAYDIPRLNTIHQKDNYTYNPPNKTIGYNNSISNVIITPAMNGISNKSYSVLWKYCIECQCSRRFEDGECSYCIEEKNKVTPLIIKEFGNVRHSSL